MRRRVCIEARVVRTNGQPVDSLTAALCEPVLDLAAAPPLANMFLTRLLAFGFWCRAAVLAITVSTSTSAYTVDTASSYGFTVAISRASCDITSLKFYNTEYQYSGTKSHIASGLGTATVSYTTSGGLDC